MADSYLWLLYTFQRTKFSKIQLHFNTFDYFYTVSGVEGLLNGTHKSSQLRNILEVFSINFATDESTLLITFLQEECKLIINNHPSKSKTRYSTTVDAVFLRFLTNCHFSTIKNKIDLFYHKNN